MLIALGYRNVLQSKPPRRGGLPDRLILLRSTPDVYCLRLLLERDGDMEVVGEASDGREAVRLADELEPALVIMDITMPQWNGIDATAQIVKRHPGVGVIILSMHSDYSDGAEEDRHLVLLY